MATTLDDTGLRTRLTQVTTATASAMLFRRGYPVHLHARRQPDPARQGRLRPSRHAALRARPPGPGHLRGGPQHQRPDVGRHRGAQPRRLPGDGLRRRSRPAPPRAISWRRGSSIEGASASSATAPSAMPPRSASLSGCRPGAWACRGSGSRPTSSAWTGTSRSAPSGRPSSPATTSWPTTTAP